MSEELRASMLNSIDKNNIEALRRILRLDKESTLRNFPISREHLFRSQECALLLMDQGFISEPLDNWPILFDAADRGYELVVELLIREGHDVNMNCVSHENVTLLQDSAEVLLENGIVNTGDLHRLTPLHVAGSWKTADLLLKNGAILEAKDTKNRTPLHFAARRCKPGLVRTLIENGADVNSLDIDGNNPVHKVMLYPSREFHPNLDTRARCVLQLLKNNGANMNVYNIFNQNPLFCLLENPCPSLLAVKEILDEEEVNIDTQDDSGQTPLHCAIHCPEIIQLYLNRLADINIESNAGKTPSESAYDKLNRDIFVYGPYFTTPYHVTLVQTLDHFSRHITKLQAAGFHVGDKNLKLALKFNSLVESALVEDSNWINEGFLQLRTSDRDCKLELGELNSHLGTSLKEFLTRDTEYRNSIINGDLISRLYAVNFPIYGEIILNKIENDKRRLLRQCETQQSQ